MEEYFIEAHILKLNNKISEFEHELINLEIELLDFEVLFTKVMRRQSLLDRIARCETFLAFWENRAQRGGKK